MPKASLKKIDSNGKDEQANPPLKGVSKKVPSDRQLKFGRRLAALDKTTRDRAVKKLSIWLSRRPDLDIIELLRVWKGLYFSMWLSDKLLVQHELSEQLASMIHVFSPTETSKTILFLRAFHETMQREWHSIDHFRLDKFLMLVRSFLRQSLEFLKKQEWNTQVLEDFNAMMEAVPLAPQSGEIGIKLHLADIYLEEVNKVAGNELDPEVLQTLLRPFYGIIVNCPLDVVVKRVIKRVFIPLMYDYRRDEEEEERMKEEDEEEPTFFNTNFEAISTRLMELASSKTTPEKNRSALYNLRKNFMTVIEEENKKQAEREERKKQEEEELKKAEEKKKNSTKNKKKTATPQKTPVTPTTTPNNNKKKQEIPKDAVALHLEKEDNKKRKKENNSVASSKQETESTKEEKFAVPSVAPSKNKKSKKEESPEQASTNVVATKGVNGTAAAKKVEQTPDKKKVIWTLESNKAQDYADSLTVHPVSPVVRHKDVKPTSILKVVTPLPRKSGSKTTTPSSTSTKTASNGSGKKQRKTAADFF